MKDKIKAIIKDCLLYSGMFRLVTLLYPNKKVAILRYHSVKDGKGNFYSSPAINVSLSTFEKHVKYFSKNYNIVSLDEVVECVCNRSPFKKNSVVFTFDDGYSDNYDAYKILQKYGGQGTFYIIAGCVSGESHLWLFEVRYLIMNASIEIVELDVNGKTIKISLEDREKAVSDVTVMIKSNDVETRDDILKQLRDQITVDKRDFEEASKKVMLTWRQANEMSESGMTIGGHTKFHCNLPNAKPDEAIKDIEDGKKCLQEHVNVEVRHFAYPNGGPYPHYNDKTKEFVKNAGFSSATTSVNGFVDINSDLFELRRVRTTGSLSETVCSLELERLKER